MKFLRKELDIDGMGFKEMKELLDLAKFLQFKIKKAKVSVECQNKEKSGCPNFTRSDYHITKRYGKKNGPLCNLCVSGFSPYTPFNMNQAKL